MKTSISSDAPSGRHRRPLVKTMARQLRDWLNHYLEDGASAAPTRQPPATGLESAVLSDPSQKDETSEPTFYGEEQPAPDWFKPAGPPEEWLRMVREGAPELLVSPEDGGTPWQGSLQAELGDQAENEKENDRIPSVASPLTPLPLSPRKWEEVLPIRARPSADKTAPVESRWFKRLKRRWTSEVFSPPADSDFSGRRSFAGPNPVASVSQPRPPRQRARETSPEPFEVRHHGSSAFPQVTAPKSQFAGAPKSQWLESGQPGGVRSQPFGAVEFQRLNLARQTESAVPHGEKPTHAGSPIVSRKAGVTGSVHTAEPASTLGLRPDPSISTGISEMLISRPRISNHPETQTINRMAGDRDAKSGDRFSEIRRSAERRSAERRWAEKWPLLSARELEPETDDPWPALPENPLTATPAYAEDASSAQHLQALDLEQRGGR